MVVHNYGTPSGHESHNAMLSDMHLSDTDDDALATGPSEMECNGEYDDTKVSATLALLNYMPLHLRGVTSPSFGWYTLHVPLISLRFAVISCPLIPLWAHLVWVVWVLTCVGAATLRLPFHLSLGKSYVALFTCCIPLTCRRALHNA
jgi:hypothetical protein